MTVVAGEVIAQDCSLFMVNWRTVPLLRPCTRGEKRGSAPPAEDEPGDALKNLLSENLVPRVKSRSGSQEGEGCREEKKTEARRLLSQRLPTAREKKPLMLSTFALWDEEWNALGGNQRSSAQGDGHGTSLPRGGEKGKSRRANACASDNPIRIDGGMEPLPGALTRIRGVLAGVRQGTGRGEDSQGSNTGGLKITGHVNPASSHQSESRGKGKKVDAALTR